LSKAAEAVQRVPMTAAAHRLAEDHALSGGSAHFSENFRLPAGEAMETRAHDDRVPLWNFGVSQDVRQDGMHSPSAQREHEMAIDIKTEILHAAALEMLAVNHRGPAAKIDDARAGLNQRGYRAERGGALSAGPELHEEI